MDVPKAKLLAARLNLPEEQRKAVVDAARLRRRVDTIVMKHQHPSAITGNLERFAPAALQVWSLLAPDREVSTRLRDYLLLWRNTRPLLTGKDLLEMGAPQGPIVGRLLRTLRAARLDDLTMTKDEERTVALHLMDQWLNSKSSRKKSASG